MKALIIVDMINADVHARKDKKRLLQNQLALIKEFKRRRLPVIITQGKTSSKENPVMRKLWGKEYAGTSRSRKEAAKQEQYNLTTISELLGAGPETIIRKEAYSAFYRTTLENFCRKKKITELYFCGISSGCCVYFTAADAAYRHIQPILVKDASGSVSPERHKKNISDFQTLLGPAMSTSEVIKSL